MDYEVIWSYESEFDLDNIAEFINLVLKTQHLSFPPACGKAGMLLAEIQSTKVKLVLLVSTKITYFLGAGASAEALPTIKTCGNNLGHSSSIKDLAENLRSKDKLEILDEKNCD